MKKQRHELRVAVLAGGVSSEREVSLRSGLNVQHALQAAGYFEVELLDPANQTFLEELQRGWDVAFIALHGAGGEDGSIQHILEFLGIPYTGSGPLASACATDKDLAKIIYKQANLPIPRGISVRSAQDERLEHVFDELNTSTLFIKPAVNGSSYGVSKVREQNKISQAVEHALKYSERALIEECCEGVEVTVGVLDCFDETIQSLPVVEICCPPGVPFYDYTTKYADPTNIHRIPAQISPEDTQAVSQLAKEAHKVLGCFGFSRSDFILAAQGPVLLETNTVPGLTEQSLFPDELKEAGIALSEVCARLIEQGITRATASMRG